MGKNFALIGVGGYIAPRHLQAIKDTGNKLVAAIDRHDSVGILDRYFFDCDFFQEFERFDRHVDKLRRLGEENRIHYVSICSPNYLHDSHIRFALKNEADAICEKPLVLNPWNLDQIEQLEQETGKRVFNILQLRVHPALVAFREKVLQQNSFRKHDVKLDYVTSRGRWYDFSWKGESTKAGGIATNIGIHFFDMLIWIFGAVKECRVEVLTNHRANGHLELERANVSWLLSIDRADLPEEAKNLGKMTYRKLTCDHEEVEFSDGFSELHTEVYRRILCGEGFGVKDVRPSIELAYQIRNAKV